MRILAVLAELDLPVNHETLADRLTVAAFGQRKVRQPARSTCAGCGRTKVPAREFTTDKSLREQGFVEHGTGDLCSGCDKRRRRGRPGPADPARRTTTARQQVSRFAISSALVAELRAADPEFVEGAA
jgi:hypothetical protein